MPHKSALRNYKPGFTLRKVWGDIFEAEDCSLALCIKAGYDENCFESGTGLKFADYFTGIETTILRQKPDIGMAPCARVGASGHYVFFPVALYSFSASEEALYFSLRSMKEEMEKRGVTRLAMAGDFCGHGEEQFMWHTIEYIMELVFKDTRVEITVYFPGIEPSRCDKEGNMTDHPDNKFLVVDLPRPHECHCSDIDFVNADGENIQIQSQHHLVDWWSDEPKFICIC